MKRRTIASGDAAARVSQLVRELVPPELNELVTNLKILQDAKPTCTCGAFEKPHYHELVRDGEVGNEYLSDDNEQHKAEVVSLQAELVAFLAFGTRGDKDESCEEARPGTRECW